jgi:uncharacterized protein
MKSMSRTVTWCWGGHGYGLPSLAKTTTSKKAPDWFMAGEYREAIAVHSRPCYIGAVKTHPARSAWPIVDMHGHTDCKDPASRDRLADAAAEMGVRHILLLGDVIAFGYHPTPEQIRFINDATIADVKARPGFYKGMCHINPENPPDFIVSEIERCVRDNGLVGVKLEATVICTDRRMEPVMETARRLGAFVIHHSWYQSVRTTEGESTPADIADLARRYPDVPIQMAHLGGARVRGILDVRPYENVWIDTSGSQPMGELIEFAVQTIGSGRIVYGSDVPGRDFSAQIGRVTGARIGEADMRRILFENAFRRLGL